MSIKTYIKGHAGLMTFLAVIIVVVMVAGGRAATKKPGESSASNVKQVTLVDATSFRDDLTTVSVEGVVESASQVDIKSQVASPVSQVYVSIGDRVSTGQRILELENADIRAQLEQARANLTLAQGMYASDAGLTDNARKAAINQVRDAYTKADDIVNAQVGQFLFNGNPNNVQLQSYVTDSSIRNSLSIHWGNAQDAIRLWKNSIDTLSDASTREQVNVAVSNAQKHLVVVSQFLDTVSNALVNATKSAGQNDLATINGWKAVASAGRATISGAISGLTSSGSSLVTNQAQVSAAQAGVRSLEAQLAKTIITAPISGTIAALPLRVGEFATPGTLLTTVVGAGGLEITAYASGNDFERITKGAPVTIGGNASGTVLSVAPSVSEITKKVEVKITVPASLRGQLVVGQSVQAKIQATTPRTSSTTTVYQLPIQNVKIVPGAAYVYTVNDSQIVKHEVTLGEVKGDFVEVTAGITDDMKIVSPVYELEEGETVRTE